MLCIRVNPDQWRSFFFKYLGFDFGYQSIHLMCWYTTEVLYADAFRSRCMIPRACWYLPSLLCLLSFHLDDRTRVWFRFCVLTSFVRTFSSFCLLSTHPFHCIYKQIFILTPKLMRDFHKHKLIFTRRECRVYIKILISFITTYFMNIIISLQKVEQSVDICSS